MDLVGARKDLHVAHDVSHADEGVADVVHRLFESADIAPADPIGSRPRPRASSRHDSPERLRNEFHVGHRHGQRIVDFMRDPGGERSRRSHALRDQELLAHSHLFRPHGGFANFASDGAGQAAQVALEQVVLRPGPHDRHGGGFSDRAGHEEERNVSATLPQVGQGTEAAVLREGIIGDDDVPRARRQRAQEGSTRFDALCPQAISIGFEFMDHELRVVVGIFDEQDRQIRRCRTLDMRTGRSARRSFVWFGMRTALPHDDGSPSAVLQPRPP